MEDWKQLFNRISNLKPEEKRERYRELQEWFSLNDLPKRKQGESGHTSISIERSAMINERQVLAFAIAEDVISGEWSRPSIYIT